MGQKTEKTKLDFKTCEEQILKRLDWRREYEAMGARFVGSESADGWLECLALFRDESKPSAAVNVGSKNGALGLYTDLGDKSDAINPWEVMARLGKAPSWQDARKYFAKKAGVELPQSKPQAASLTEREAELRIKKVGEPMASGWMQRWVSTKPGVTIEAALAAGAEVVGGQFGICVRFYAYRPGEWDSPAAALLYRCDGEDFPASSDGKLHARKIHEVGGYKGDKLGLIIVGTPEQLAAASRVILCEGTTDALSVAPHLPAGAIAVTASAGAKKFTTELAEAFHGKRVDVVYDADAAGESGADNACRCCLGVASEVRNLKLPYPITEKHGRDVRDLVSEGGFAGWLAEVEATPALAAADLPAEEAAGGKSGPLPITNFLEEANPDGTTSTKPLMMQQIIGRLKSLSGDWPRRVDSCLFVAKDGRIDWLDSAASLFGWLQHSFGTIEWKRSQSCVAKEEFFCELRRTAPAYSAIEALPHEPALPGHFYAGGKGESGDGSSLAALIDRFLPATPVDRDLIQAAMMTVVWGGHGGTRPCFVITSDDGRGVGKSKLAEMIGHIVGGFIAFSNNDPIADIKARLLSPDGLTKRVALLDNVKSLRFSWAELEALITAPVVSGKRMYVGEASRPNTITWFITLNGASLSTDMAQRAIPIKLKRPSHSGDWEESTLRFVFDNREKIVADLLGWLRNDAAMLEKFSRWATWERYVLARLPEPAAVQSTVGERQSTVDVEIDEAQHIEEYFADRLRGLKYFCESERVFIPSMVAADWFNKATNQRATTIGACRSLSQLCSEGRFKSIQPNLDNSKGRGFVWAGSKATGNTTCMDIKARIENQKNEQTQNT